jgi:hypothetical protein
VYPDERSAYFGAISSNSFVTTWGSFGNAGDDGPAGRQVVPLRERGSSSRPTLDLLGLRLGGLDALVAEDRDRSGS